MKPRSYWIIPMLIGFAIIFPGIVSAETTILGPHAYLNWTYQLDSGDLIEWDWEVVGAGTVDFWLEDEDGTKYSEVEDGTIGHGWFAVPSDGEWTINFQNNNEIVIVTLQYDFSIANTGVIEDIFNDILLFVIIGAIVIIAVIILIVLVIIKVTKEPQQPQYPPQYQQPMYSQQPQQYPQYPQYTQQPQQGGQQEPPKQPPSQ